MNALLSIVAVVAAGLAGVIVFELRPSPLEPEPVSAASSAAGPDVGTPAAVVAPAAAGVSDETLLARPLFSQTRRPPNVASPTAAVASAAPLPRMTGILIDGPNRRAIFAGTQDGKAVTVGEGGRLGAFTVQSIEPRQVTVIGPGGPRTLRTAFDPSLPPPAAVPGGSFVPPLFPGIQVPGAAQGGRMPGGSVLSPGVPSNAFPNPPPTPGLDAGNGSSPGAAR